MDKYFDDYNPDLLPLIPPDAKVILEVGCGTGRLCEAYRRINPGVEWRGIEDNREAASAADNRGVQIIGSDVECWSWGLNERRQVDCVIFGDVLEHLRDPWMTLKNLAGWVKPGAQVLASIPNVQHYSVILGLLRGRWPYSSEGLLDWTHLRFFTLEGIKEMFSMAGLDVFEIRGRRVDCEADFRDWEQVLARLSMPDLVKPSMVYQYLVRSIRPVLKTTHGEIVSMSRVPIPRLHIHAIGDGTICERPRLHEPMAMLSTIPGVRYNVGRTLNRHEGGLQDILIEQRFRHISLDVQRELVQDCLVIAEIDDDPEWLVGLPECDFLPLRAVHAIQTTTEVMAETCRRFNPNVAVFPNQIASLPAPNDHRDWAHSDNPKVVNIFFGALNREKDWAPIMPAINRVLDGIDPQDIWFRVVSDRAFYDALSTYRKDFTPFCQWPEYRKILRSCDIALLPLEDNRVNRHKSDLKFLECAAEGVTCLMSTFAADQLEAVKTNDAYRCYFDSSSFERNLKILVEHTRGRQRTAEIAYAYVRDHRLLSQHYRRRHEWYVDLLSERKGLTRDLLERVTSLCPHSPEPDLAGSQLVPEANPA